MSNLLLIECKDYKGAVGVDQLGKFLDDIRDISEGELTYKIRPIMAINSNLAEGAFNKAKNRGVGLVKLNSEKTLTHILNRKYRYQNVDSKYDVEGIFVKGELPSSSNLSYMMYAQSQWFFGVEDYIKFLIGQPFNNSSQKVDFIPKVGLDNLAEKILMEIDYSDGSVNLDKIVLLDTSSHITIVKDVTNHDHQLLGKIDFIQQEIYLYKQSDDNLHRDRFTLAHEISHILLDHGRYLIKDTFSNEDMNGESRNRNGFISKLEFQANYLASCILMPKKTFVDRFLEIYKKLGLTPRGKVFLYNDKQECNKIMVNNVLVGLSRHFNVSKKAVEIRLKDLGILFDESNFMK
ncbi:ImmA/IrrE family metallo-endopeptidase, partial [Psychrobacter alimentarius]|uniref:ImmA/IrrE family metallo-endopeptidase n=2 Tax=Moraxellaceae TaxID=468 RepID=UPI000BAAB1D1|nr:ImmA/IrrE family metallo-endopeptidase [Psychrobacter sp. JB193]PAT64808.1 hypothetical protein CIK80_07035 [Psychrobacter sp. JB193]